MSTVARVPPSKRLEGRKQWVARHSDGVGGWPEVTFATKEEAEDYLITVAVAARKKKRVPDLLLGVLADLNLEKICNGLAQETIYNHEFSNGVVKKFLGEMFVREVTPAVVTDFRDQLEVTAAPTTARRANNMLRRILDLGVDRKLIDENPYDRLPKKELRAEAKLPPPKERSMPELLSEEDFVLLLVHESDGPGRTVVLLALLAGLRIGEIICLTWDDVRWAEGVLDVKTLKKIRVRRGQPEAPDKPEAKGALKTEYSHRRVEMTAMLVSHLRKVAGNAGGSGGDFVCRKANGRQMTQNTALRLVKEQQVAAGIGTSWKEARTDVLPYPPTKFSGVADTHGLRHACVAFWIWAGVDDVTISKWIGHFDEVFTMDFYGYLVGEKNRGAKTWPTGGRANKKCEGLTDGA